MEKKCTRCLETKSLEEFAKSKQVKSGYGAWCKTCSREVKRESNARVKAADPDVWIERRRAYVRTYRERHPDRVKEQERRRNLRQYYGITIEQYEALLSDQNGKCAGCQTRPDSKRFAVDHDHKCCPGRKSCGKCIRGLLCSRCNTALGLMNEDKQIIVRLLTYMES